MSRRQLIYISRTGSSITKPHATSSYLKRYRRYLHDPHLPRPETLTARQPLIMAHPPRTRADDRRTFQALIDDVTANPDNCQILYISERHWPVGGEHPNYPSGPATKPHIVILDSSFNPPHYAHLSMAASSLPPPLPSSSSTPPKDVQPYTARLLLFSVRNIEKTPKPGDASVMQRLEMTILLARRLARDHALPGGVAVGILNEPTFVGKSRIVHSFLSRCMSSEDKVAKLSFLIGSDTLTRFFEPKFYGGMEGMDKASEEYFADDEPGKWGEDRSDGSLLICGRRGAGEENRRVEEEVLSREKVRPWVDKGCVRMLGSGQEGWEEVSSTSIRKAVKEGDRGTLEKLVPSEIVEYIMEEGLYTA